MVYRNNKLADVDLTSSDKLAKIRMIFQDCAIWPTPLADHMNEVLAKQNRMTKFLGKNEETRRPLRYFCNEYWTVPKCRVE
jgi:hypothetical protein